MAWRHREVRAQGKALIVRDGAPIAADYEMGIITTGRARVFAGHFISLTLPSGTEFSGENERSMRDALHAVAHSLAVVDLELRCAGLEADFTESGLSLNTGSGYLPGCDGPIHMLDVPPTPECPHGDAFNIDDFIRDTVAEMRIGMGGKCSSTYETAT